MKLVGFPLERDNGSMDYCCSSSIQVEYGDDDLVDFVGTSYDERMLVTYKGQNVFKLNARELFEFINAHEDDPSEYTDYEYVFPSQIVTLWDADSQYDYLGGEQKPVWAQVGVGTESYLRAINAIHDRKI
ncbi:hypothetical protein SAMN02745181_3658 [Rubritalea squalenifaciens DSM 18772]|uniref:Uncharacterized protein n=3 Tax=Rubritaleaceae TaxID=1648490 RepID=A0A1M6RQG8_9BACT|nr:hypothetical protein SAMN02745181_3658 [Rubritalea squalenifaciens DSM 18772]